MVNGLHSGSRTRRELLERLQQAGPALHLLSPLCLTAALHSGDAAGNAAGGGPSGDQAVVLPQGGVDLDLDEEAVASLGWIAQGAAGGSGAGAGGSCAASCCPLPDVCVCVPASGHQFGAGDDSGSEDPATAAAAAAAGARGAGEWREAAVAPQHQAEPAADSDATQASQPGARQLQVQLSPVAAAAVAAAATEDDSEVPEAGGKQLHRVPTAAAAAVEGAEEVEEWEDGAENGAAAPPEWLLQGLAAVAERSQGSVDVVEGEHLRGRRWVGWGAQAGAQAGTTVEPLVGAARVTAPPPPPPPGLCCCRVAFVLLEDFEQDDPCGIRDTVWAGVLEGQ